MSSGIIQLMITIFVNNIKLPVAEMRRFFYSHSGIIWKSDLSLTTLTTLTNASDTFISSPIQDSVEFPGCYNCQSCQSCQSVKVSKCQTACSTLKKVEWILSLTL